MQHRVALSLSSLALALYAHTLSAQSLSTSTAIGGPTSDAVRAVAIQSDGTIIAAGTFGSLELAGTTIRALGSATSASNGIVLRLSADGRTVLAAARVAAAVSDLALDASDRVYVAGGASGAIVLSPTLDAVVRAHEGATIGRIDVGADGTYAALAVSNASAAETAPGAGRVTIYRADGAVRAAFDGYRNTLDLAIDTSAQRVVTIGWRQDNAFDGSSTQPVQIAYMRGTDLDGATQWTNYDWSTDRASQSFINRATNNMADTRGYRVSVGRDRRLLAAFECAGGNHIFRYAPRDVTRAVDIVGGDPFHTFSNTRSEHKTFFAVYDASTGEYRLGQQLVGRLASGAGNTVRVSEGAITSDERGNVLLTGAAAFGLPLTERYAGTGDYTGGAYLLVMSPDLRRRLLLTRVDPGGHGHGVDARAGTIVYGGNTSDTGMEFFSQNALQPRVNGMKDGFVALFGASSVQDGGAAPTDAAAPSDASADAATASDSGLAPNVDGGEGGAIASGCGCRASPTREDRSIASPVMIAAAALLTTRARRRARR